MRTTKTNIRTYSELQQLKTVEERFEYLALHGSVGHDTFGFDRYLNQIFYKTPEWLQARNDVIVRDMGKDVLLDVEIVGTILVHHMNPITVKDILERSEYLLNPEYLISVSDPSHRAIHYGNAEYLNRNKIATRTANDHCPWVKEKGGHNYVKQIK